MVMPREQDLVLARPEPPQRRGPAGHQRLHGWKGIRGGSVLTVCQQLGRGDAAGTPQRWPRSALTAGSCCFILRSVPAAAV